MRHALIVLMLCPLRCLRVHSPTADELIAKNIRPGAG